MKFAVVVCVLWSMTAFAASGLFSSGERSSIDGGGYVTYYAGKGGMIYADAREERHNYKVTLKIATLPDGRALWEYNFVEGFNNRYQRLIIDKESDGFQKIFVPAAKDRQDDFAAYVETGWAHKVEYENLQKEENTAKKRTLLLHYLDPDGNRVTHHVLAYKDGSKKFISTGSVGNAKGVTYIWGHELVQVIERLPEDSE